MTQLFRWFGVDYLQWKALTRTLLRADFRLPLHVRRASVGRIWNLATLVLMLTIFGAGAAAVVFLTTDLLLSGTLALAYLSVMLVSTLLTQHGVTLLTTADYGILGPRPVSSQTFLAIRVTNLVFHTLLLTALMAYPVVLAYTLAPHGNVVRGMAAAGAIVMWSLTVALTLVASYAALLRFAGAARFHRAVGYLQLFAGFMSYGGLLLVGRALGRSVLSNASLPDEWWIVLIPPAWFASYLEIAGGAMNRTTLIRAAISVSVLALLVLLLRNRFGLDYARRLAELPVAAAPSRVSRGRTPFFMHGEARAVAILVVAHFTHDLRVRMGILAVVPLVLFSMVLGSRDASFDLLALSVLVFPAVLLQHFAATDSYRAAWVYGCTPASHANLIIALKNITVVYFLVPFLVFMAAVFTWRLGDPGRAMAQAAMLGLLSHLVLQAAIIIKPSLPFALPPDKVRGNTALIGWMFVVILGGQLAVVALDRWVYISPARTMSALVVLALLSWALNRLIGWRVGQSQLTRWGR